MVPCEFCRCPYFTRHSYQKKLYDTAKGIVLLTPVGQVFKAPGAEDIPTELGSMLPPTGTMEATAHEVPTTEDRHTGLGSMLPLKEPTVHEIPTTEDRHTGLGSMLPLKKTIAPTATVHYYDSLRRLGNEISSEAAGSAPSSLIQKVFMTYDMSTQLWTATNKSSDRGENSDKECSNINMKNLKVALDNSAKQLQIRLTRKRIDEAVDNKQLLNKNKTIVKRSRKEFGGKLHMNLRGRRLINQPSDSTDKPGTSGFYRKESPQKPGTSTSGSHLRAIRKRQNSSEQMHETVRGNRKEPVKLQVVTRSKSNSIGIKTRSFSKRTTDKYQQRRINWLKSSRNNKAILPRRTRHGNKQKVDNDVAATSQTVDSSRDSTDFSLLKTVGLSKANMRHDTTTELRRSQRITGQPANKFLLDASKKLKNEERMNKSGRKRRKTISKIQSARKTINSYTANPISKSHVPQHQTANADSNREDIIEPKVEPKLEIFDCSYLCTPTYFHTSNHDGSTPVIKTEVEEPEQGESQLLNFYAPFSSHVGGPVVRLLGPVEGSDVDVEQSSDIQDSFINAVNEPSESACVHEKIPNMGKIIDKLIAPVQPEVFNANSGSLSSSQQDESVYKTGSSLPNEENSRSYFYTHLADARRRQLEFRNVDTHISDRSKVSSGTASSTLTESYQPQSQPTEDEHHAGSADVNAELQTTCHVDEDNKCRDCDINSVQHDARKNLNVLPVKNRPCKFSNNNSNSESCQLYSWNEVENQPGEGSAHLSNLEMLSFVASNSDSDSAASVRIVDKFTTGVGITDTEPIHSVSVSFNERKGNSDVSANLKVVHPDKIICATILNTPEIESPHQSIIPQRIDEEEISAHLPATESNVDMVLEDKPAENRSRIIKETKEDCFQSENRDSKDSSQIIRQGEADVILLQNASPQSSFQLIAEDDKDVIQAEAGPQQNSSQLISEDDEDVVFIEDTDSQSSSQLLSEGHEDVIKAEATTLQGSSQLINESDKDVILIEDYPIQGSSIMISEGDGDLVQAEAAALEGSSQLINKADEDAIQKEATTLKGISHLINEGDVGVVQKEATRQQNSCQLINESDVDVILIEDTDSRSSSQPIDEGDKDVIFIEDIGPQNSSQLIDERDKDAIPTESAPIPGSSQLINAGFEDIIQAEDTTLLGSSRLINAGDVDVVQKEATRQQNSSQLINECDVDVILIEDTNSRSSSQPSDEGDKDVIFIDDIGPQNSSQLIDERDKDVIPIEGAPIQGSSQMINAGDEYVIQAEATALEGSSQLINAGVEDVNQIEAKTLLGISELINEGDEHVNQAEATTLLGSPTLINVGDEDVIQTEVTALQGNSHLINEGDKDIIQTGATDLEGNYELINAGDEDAIPIEDEPMQGSPTLISEGNDDVIQTEVTALQGSSQLINEGDKDIIQTGATDLEGSSELINVGDEDVVQEEATTLQSSSELINVGDEDVVQEEATTLQGSSELINVGDEDVVQEEATTLQSSSELINVGDEDVVQEEATTLQGSSELINVGDEDVVQEEATTLQSSSELINVGDEDVVQEEATTLQGSSELINVGDEDVVQEEATTLQSSSELINVGDEDVVQEEATTLQSSSELINVGDEDVVQEEATTLQGSSELINVGDEDVVQEEATTLQSSSELINVGDEDVVQEEATTLQSSSELINVGDEDVVQEEATTLQSSSELINVGDEDVVQEEATTLQSSSELINVGDEDVVQEEATTLQSSSELINVGDEDVIQEEATTLQSSSELINVGDEDVVQEEATTLQGSSELINVGDEDVVQEEATTLQCSSELINVGDEDVVQEEATTLQSSSELINVGDEDVGPVEGTAPQSFTNMVPESSANLRSKSAEDQSVNDSVTISPLLNKNYEDQAELDHSSQAIGSSVLDATNSMHLAELERGIIQSEEMVPDNSLKTIGESNENPCQPEKVPSHCSPLSVVESDLDSVKMSDDSLNQFSHSADKSDRQDTKFSECSQSAVERNNDEIRMENSVQRSLLLIEIDDDIIQSQNLVERYSPQVTKEGNKPAIPLANIALDKSSQPVFKEKDDTLPLNAEQGEIRSENSISKTEADKSLDDQGAAIRDYDTTMTQSFNKVPSSSRSNSEDQVVIRYDTGAEVLITKSDLVAGDGDTGFTERIASLFSLRYAPFYLTCFLYLKKSPNCLPKCRQIIIRKIGFLFYASL